MSGYGLTFRQSVSRYDRLPSDSELVEFSIYPLEHGAAVERQVLALPLGRELDRLDALRNAVAVYRLAFGQARRRT